MSVPTGLARKILTSQQAGLMIVIVVLATVIAIAAGSQQVVVQQVRNEDGSVTLVKATRNKFLNADVLVGYATNTSVVAIMAVGMAAVIISAGIDLSVGSIYALAAVVGAMVLEYYGPTGSGRGLPIWGTLIGIAATMAVALLCGLINGAGLVALKVHPFIITMGTMLVFRGIAFVSTKARSIGDFPRPTTAMIKTDLGLSNLGIGIGLQPVPMLVMLVIAVLGTLYLSYTVAGRHVYAVGGNPEAARFSGLRTSRVLLSVYVVVGFCAGVAAVVANGLYGAAQCARGEGYELKVIAAAVVGGASLSGGRGTAFGALLGAMLIALIEQGIITLGIDQNYNYIIIGLAIVIAVVLDRLSSRAAERRLSAARQRQIAPAGTGTEKGAET